MTTVRRRFAAEFLVAGSPRALAGVPAPASSGIPRSHLTLINRTGAYAHNDPAGAYPHNAFFAGIVRFLKKVDVRG